MSREVIISSIQLPAPDYAVETPLVQIKENNLGNVLEGLKIAGERKSDIVCLGEVFTTVGASDKYDYSRCVEDIPGPVLGKLSHIARQYKMYIIAPVLGRCEGVIRNTALVIDRKGDLSGRYEKVHLTVFLLKDGFPPLIPACRDGEINQPLLHNIC